MIRGSAVNKMPQQIFCCIFAEKIVNILKNHLQNTAQSDIIKKDMSFPLFGSLTWRHKNDIMMEADRK